MGVINNLINLDNNLITFDCSLNKLSLNFFNNIILISTQFKSGLNPRGVLDFSPLYLFSRGILKWQVKPYPIMSRYIFK